MADELEITYIQTSAMEMPRSSADFIREIGLPTTFAEMNLPADTDYKAIADSTVLTGGCAKKFTREKLLEVLLECR